MKGWHGVRCAGTGDKGAGKQKKLQQLRMMATELLYEDARDKVTQRQHEKK